MNTPKHALLLALSSATVALAAAPAAASAAPFSQSFGPGHSTFVVPGGVTSLSVTADGAGGGLDSAGQGCLTGRGGEISGNLTVTPGEVLTIDVGGRGGDGSGTVGGAGGAGGGAPGGGSPNASGYGGGGGGGGQTAISDPSGPLTVAGGGGGCGGYSNGKGGNGGSDGAPGFNGDNARGGWGGGATAGAGGESFSGPADAGAPGVAGAGGAGGAGQLGGGGGGGGWPFGGGGGGGEESGVCGAGGGGGGDYVAPGAGLTITPNVNAGDGHVDLSWTPPGTTVGGLFAPTNSSHGIFVDTLLQTGGPATDLPGAPSWTVPSDGVITAWQYESGPDVPSAVELKVGRGTRAADGSGTYSIVGEATSSGSLTANGVSTFPAQVPVQAGDALGAYVNGVADYAVVKGKAEEPVATAGDQHVGAPAALYTTTTIDPSIFMYDGDPVVPIRAFLEPDADHDGFGDISQDMCPGEPGSVRGCPLADLGVTSTSTTAAGLVTFVETITNHGPDAVPGAAFSDNPGAGATIVSVAAPGSACNTSAGRCTLGALANGQSETVTITVRPPASGQVANTATVFGPHVPAGIGAGDPNSANDTATDSAVVTAPAAGAPTAASAGAQTPPAGGAQPSSGRPRFAGVVLRLGGPVTVRRSTARLVLVTSSAAGGNVTVTAGKVRLARASFTLKRTGPVVIRLSAGAVKLVRAHRGSIRVRIVVQSRNGAGASASTIATAVLRLAR
jgi:Domain of unknown function DUF11